MQMGWLIDLFVFVSKIFHHKLRESPAPFSCEIPETIARTRVWSPIKISNTTHPLYTAQHHSHSYSHHFTINSTVVIIFRFSCCFFYLLWFSAAARIKCFTFHSPTVIHRSSSSNITLFMPLCIFIRCVTSMKSVWSFTFHNDSGVWRTQESEKSHSFLFLPLVRYSNMVYSTIFSLLFYFFVGLQFKWLSPKTTAAAIRLLGERHAYDAMNINK